jgi:hypothetical protein
MIGRLKRTVDVYKRNRCDGDEPGSKIKSSLRNHTYISFNVWKPKAREFDLFIDPRPVEGDTA